MDQSANLINSDKLAIDRIRALCAQDPAYKDGAAYVRTKILCDVLTKQGHPIPSWLVLREYIGKGSSNDISRGVKDYRLEHADLLQRMTGLPVGIPPALAQPMHALWQAALEQASAAFEEKSLRVQAAQAEAEHHAATALQERDDMAANLAVAIEKTTGLQAAVEQQRERANEERAAREQAERMAEKHIADLTQQRDSLTKVVEANTTELRTLNTRLEGERHRALREVEAARQQVELARQQAYREGEQKLAHMESKLRGEMANETMNSFRLQQECDRLKTTIAELRSLLSAEAKTTRRRPATKAAPKRNMRILRRPKRV